VSRLFILGSAPLPSEAGRRQYAANLRTWHFTKPLLDEGHRIRLVAGRIPNTYPANTEPVLLRTVGNLEYLSVAEQLFHDHEYLRARCWEFNPDGIIGVNTYPSSRAVRLSPSLPVWCDLNGWSMAEAQTKAHVYDDDRYLSHFWNMEQAVLDRADVISTVSEAQAHATVGELAARGRLNRRTLGFRFVHTIVNAAVEAEPATGRHLVRNRLVDDEAFVVLWTGGYNTWTDVDLLADALFLAMRRVERLHYVSTGGAIDGHDELTFPRFRSRALESEFRDRFHFVGWVPTSDVPAYYAESDLGLNIDGDNYESLFGARNRLNDMMRYGLPVLTTIRTEISKTIASNRLGMTCPAASAARLARRLEWASNNPDRLAEMAHAARRYVRDSLTYTRTTRELRAWARAPYRAPDLGHRADFTGADFFQESPEPEG